MALRTIDWRGKQKKKRGGTVCVCVPFARQRVGKCATWRSCLRTYKASVPNCRVSHTGDFGLFTRRGFNFLSKVGCTVRSAEHRATLGVTRTSELPGFSE